MRILILSNSDSGLYHFRKELIEMLTQENDVICSSPDTDGFLEKLEKLGCKCILTRFNRKNVNPIKEFELFNKYRSLIKKINPDVVLTYTIKPNIYGGLAAQISHKPYIANITGLGTAIVNGGLLGKVSMALYKLGLKHAKCVFFQNSDNQFFFEKSKVVTSNTKLIPGSGVNINTHTYEDYPLDATQFRFLFVGRVMKDKGIEELLKSIKQLSIDNSVFLDIVGACEEDYFKIIEQYEKLGIVKYHGRQNNVHKYYSESHCVVLPSYHEGMANVLLEAASTGRPVIATRVPGCMETFDEGVTGISCEARDVKSLYEAMKKMIGIPWDERRKMGYAGREKVKNQFDRSLIIKSYLEVLASL